MARQKGTPGAVTTHAREIPMDPYIVQAVVSRLVYADPSPWFTVAPCEPTGTCNIWVKIEARQILDSAVAAAGVVNGS